MNRNSPFATSLNYISSRHKKRQYSITEAPLTTIGGRVYMTSVTLDGQPFTLVIDTGSADAWVASAGFRYFQSASKKSANKGSRGGCCGFNASYNPDKSDS